MRSAPLVFAGCYASACVVLSGYASQMREIILKFICTVLFPWGCLMEKQSRLFSSRLAAQPPYPLILSWSHYNVSHVQEHMNRTKKIYPADNIAAAAGPPAREHPAVLLKVRL